MTESAQTYIHALVFILSILALTYLNQSLRISYSVIKLNYSTVVSLMSLTTSAASIPTTYLFPNI